jgi:hypothetical protein
MTGETQARQWQLVLGADAPPAPMRELRSGPVTALLDGVELRRVRLGDVELVRRIYVAVRDPRWDTIPGAVRDLVVDEREASFEIHFGMDHGDGELVFSWEGLIAGDEQGRIAFSMTGRAEQELVYNRIGICLLLPPAMAGRPLRAKEGGRLWEGHLPADIGPQRSKNGVLLALHPAAERLEVDLATGGMLVLGFAGDLFESEDQRNWTDASFKIYSTPLSLGIPRRSEAGALIAQQVTLSREGAPDTSAKTPPLHLEIGGPTGTVVPKIGLGLASPAPSHSDAELTRLATLKPSHLRFECHLDSPAWSEELQRVLGDCSSLGTELELVLFLRSGSDGTDELAAALAGAPVARVLVFEEGAVTNSPTETSPRELLARVREGLGGLVPVVGGTDLNFCEINRTRPDLDLIDGLAWPMSPQVHAFDDTSIFETPQAQAAQIKTAQHFAPGKALFVGPITLLPRYNPNVVADRGPSPADRRQATLLAAAFTLSSLKQLSEAGVDAVTYYETVGARGTIAEDPGSPDSPLARNRPGVFPAFHVIADVVELAGREVLEVTSSQALSVVGLAARHDGVTTLLIANTTPADLAVELAGLGSRGTIRRLNTHSAATAGSEPGHFRKAREGFEAKALDLGPYETVRLDIGG